MTENPYPKYIDTEGMRHSFLCRAWNEGYNQAIEDAVGALIMETGAYSFVQLKAMLKALRKKVSE